MVVEKFIICLLLSLLEHMMQEDKFQENIKADIVWFALSKDVFYFHINKDKLKTMEFL